MFINTPYKKEEPFIPDPKALAEYMRKYPEYNEVQATYQLEQIAKQDAETINRRERARSQREWEKEAPARKAAAEAEEKRLREEALRKQVENQRKAEEETRKLQEAARKVYPNGSAAPMTQASAEQAAAYLAKLKAERTAPNRMGVCDACRGPVQLVDGRLPEFHFIDRQDESYVLHKNVKCFCYQGRTRF